MTSWQFIPAPEAAAMVRSYLADGKPDAAVRWLTEAVARLIASNGEEIPAGVLAEPETTGDLRYDTVLATAFLYACTLCGIEAPAWTNVAPLEREWLWGGDEFESEAYKDLIRSQTPPVFLERNILTRPRDWVNA